MFLKKQIRELLIASLILLGIYLFWQNNLLLSTWLSGLILVLWLLKPLWKDWLVVVAGVVLGTGVEILAVEIGFESYTNPSFAGIPLWMPFLWGLILLLAKRVFGPEEVK